MPEQSEEPHASTGRSQQVTAHDRFQAGIYAIEYTPSGAIYVGQANCIQNRWNEHLRRLKAGSHHNRRLQALWNDHPEHEFRLYVVRLAPTKLSPLGLQRWLVQEERKLFEEKRRSTVVLNEVTPEIVSTRRANIEFEREQRDLYRRKERSYESTTAQARDRISYLQNIIDQNNEGICGLKDEYDAKLANYKRWSGWRRIFNKRPEGYDAAAERKEIQALNHEIIRRTRNLAPLEGSIATLESFCAEIRETIFDDRVRYH